MNLTIKTNIKEMLQPFFGLPSGKKRNPYIGATMIVIVINHFPYTIFTNKRAPADCPL